MNQPSSSHGGILQAFNAAPSRASTTLGTPSQGTDPSRIRAPASLGSTPTKVLVDGATPPVSTPLLPHFPPMAGVPSSTPDEIPELAQTGPSGERAVARDALYHKDMSSMVPPPPPDFDAAHVYASPSPAQVPPKGVPLTLPASLQAAVADKTVPIAGQNMFSKVEAADGTFIDKIPIAPPDLFKLISEHKSTPMMSFRLATGRRTYPPTKLNNRLRQPRPLCRDIFYFFRSGVTPPPPRV